MERGGWIRIVEASVSALIVLTALFVFYTQQHTPVEQDLGEFGRSILEEIALNMSSRREVLAGNLNNVNRTIAERLQGKNLIFEIRVCNLNDACGKSRYTPGNVYSAERVITGSLAKKIRLFMWRAA
ncbi:MAG: hypothetical protein AABX12_05545 [Nanoarchaeota archaeon]